MADRVGDSLAQVHNTCIVMQHQVLRVVTNITIFWDMMSPFSNLPFICRPHNITERTVIFNCTVSLYLSILMLCNCPLISIPSLTLNPAFDISEPQCNFFTSECYKF